MCSLVELCRFGKCRTVRCPGCRIERINRCEVRSFALTLRTVSVEKIAPGFFIRVFLCRRVAEDGDAKRHRRLGLCAFCPEYGCGGKREYDRTAPCREPFCRVRFSMPACGSGLYTVKSAMSKPIFLYAVIIGSGLKCTFVAIPRSAICTISALRLSTPMPGMRSRYRCPLDVCLSVK